MPVPRPPRLVALVGGTAAALTTLCVAVPAEAAPSAPAPSKAPVAMGVFRTVAPSTATVRKTTLLTITVKAGSVQLVTGVLSRTTSQRIGGRLVAVWVRKADTGTWQRAALLTTNAKGVVRYRIVRRPDQQFTLRFKGDRAFRPAASATLVPTPSARALDPGLVAALGKARKAARKAGLTLVVNSGYRTWSKQQRMYDAAVRQYGSARAARLRVLPPAESTHVRGLALDLGGPTAAAWVVTRGARWGLCRTYGNEPWHVEYRPDWVKAFGGRCPPTVATPGHPDPVSPLPHVPIA
jgi:D-alanyl-D-alanine carboxypeptidase